MRVFDVMNAFGVKPDVSTSSALISACGKASKEEEAIRVIDEIHASGVKLDVITFNASISACGMNASANGTLLNIISLYFPVLQNLGTGVRILLRVLVLARYWW